MDVIRLIASDLDATLLDDQSQLPPDFAETVRALAERGIRFAAASGRPIYTLEEMFAPLQDDIILVGDNGGAICWKGESLYLSEMDVADWHTLAGQARSAGHAAVLCGLETAYVEEQFRPYDRVFKRFYTKVEYVPHLEDVTARVDKFTIYFPEGDAQKGYDALYGPVWGGRFSVAVAFWPRMAGSVNRISEEQNRERHRRKAQMPFFFIGIKVRPAPPRAGSSRWAKGLCLWLSAR